MEALAIGVRLARADVVVGDLLDDLPAEAFGSTPVGAVLVPHAVRVVLPVVADARVRDDRPRAGKVTAHDGKLPPTVSLQGAERLLRTGRDRGVLPDRARRRRVVASS